MEPAEDREELRGGTVEDAEAPRPLRKSTQLTWQRRWTRLLACTAAMLPDDHRLASEWHHA